MDACHHFLCIYYPAGMAGLDDAGIYGGDNNVGSDRRKYYVRDFICRRNDAVMCFGESCGFCGDGHLFREDRGGLWGNP